MMKKIINILLLSLMALAYVACSPEEKNIFPDSSAERIEAALKESREILTNAKNGWLIEYYPSSSQTYGGYHILAAFKEDGKVTVASEEAQNEETATSTYDLIQSAGPILTFDTYNEIFHFFSNPKNPEGIGEDSKGMEGDLEFRIMRKSNDSIVLQGRKTLNKIVMTPLPEELSWAKYLEDIKTASQKMTFRAFECQVGDKKYLTSVAYRMLTISASDEQGLVTQVKSPFIQTLTGYKLYTPLTIDGVTVNEFTYVSEGNEVYLISENNLVKLVPAILPINQQLSTDTWYFKYSEIGSVGKSYWNIAKEKLDQAGEKLQLAALGIISAENDYYGLILESVKPSTGESGGVGIIMDVTNEGTDQVKYDFSGSLWGIEAMLDYYWTDLLFQAYMVPFNNRNFVLTTDNPASPTWIKMVDDENPNNTYTLYKEKVEWPYEN